MDQLVDMGFPHDLAAKVLTTDRCVCVCVVVLLCCLRIVELEV